MIDSNEKRRFLSHLGSGYSRRNKWIGSQWIFRVEDTDEQKIADTNTATDILIFCRSIVDLCPLLAYRSFTFYEY